MQTWAWRGSGAERYCGLWEKKGDFIPLSCLSIIAHLEKKCCKVVPLKAEVLWVTSGDPRTATCSTCPCCSPRVQHNVPGAGWHLGDKDVSRMWVWRAKGSSLVNCFIQVRFKLLLQHRTGSTRGGNLSNFQCEAGEETLHCEMWLSGLTAVCEEGDGRYQVLWGDKPSCFAAFGRPGLWHAHLVESTPLLHFPVKFTTAPWVCWLFLGNTSVFYWKFSKTYFGTLS